MPIASSETTNRDLFIEAQNLAKQSRMQVSNSYRVWVTEVASRAYHDAMSTKDRCDDYLPTVLEEFGCQTGTIHQCRADGALRLVSQIGVPAGLLEKVTVIPIGKGIAGAAAERKEPVELCNLQEDLGAFAKPGARETGVSGSIAVPIFSAATGEVIGTLGIGKFAPHTFSDDEKSRLFAHAEQIAEWFGHNSG